MKEKNLQAKAGDILLMRSGWVKWYENHSPEERLQKVTHGNDWIGMEVTEDSLEWLWDTRFAAVAGDSIGFEVTPIGCCGKYCTSPLHLVFPCFGPLPAVEAIRRKANGLTDSNARLLYSRLGHAH